MKEQQEIRDAKKKHFKRPESPIEEHKYSDSDDDYEVRIIQFYE